VTTLAQAQVIRGETGFTAFDGSFRAVTGASATVRHLVDADAHEGPVYAADENALYFTSVPRDGTVRVKRVQLVSGALGPAGSGPSVVPTRTCRANGMTLDRDGHLVVCEQGDLTHRARISSVDRFTGAVQPLVDRWHDLPLNSPNDVVVRSDGTIWFTDPSYGYLQGFRPRPSTGDYVYRFDPMTRALDVVDDSFDKPNGLAFSPDEQVLYITDSGANQEPGSFHAARPHHVVAFDVIGGRRLSGRRLVAVTSPGIPDGLKVDVAGRVYVSSEAGVLVLSPEGDLLGRIDVPGAVNFTFGGPDRNLLFITTDTAIWVAVLDTQGS
jgi:gluconolactonase